MEIDDSYFKALRAKYTNLFKANSPLQSIYGKIREAKDVMGRLPEICERYSDYEIYYWGHSTLNGPCPDWHNPHEWIYHRIILVSKLEKNEWLKEQYGKRGINQEPIPLASFEACLPPTIKKERSKRLLL